MIAFMLRFAGAVGLMLHHFTMAVIFCMNILNLSFTDASAQTFSMGMILFLVLLQHLVTQSLPNGILRTLLLFAVEGVFQWTTFSLIGEVGTTVYAVASICLAMSHWLFFVKAAFGVLYGLGNVVVYVADFSSPRAAKKDDEGVAMRASVVSQANEDSRKMPVVLLGNEEASETSCKISETHAAQLNDTKSCGVNEEKVLHGYSNSSIHIFKIFAASSSSSNTSPMFYIKVDVEEPNKPASKSADNANKTMMNDVN